MKKILITGATGFIGSRLVEALVNQGYRIAIIKREQSDPWRINSHIDKIITYNCDLKYTPGILQIVNQFKPDIIFHLAAYYAVEHETEEIERMNNTNIMGLLNLLEAAKSNQIDFLVNTSTCFVYDNSPVMINENSTIKPYNLYAFTKLCAEYACSFYADNYKIKTITFRLFPPYGPKDNDRKLIPYVIKTLYHGDPLKLTTGKQKWDFIYVDDIISAYMKLLKLPHIQEGHNIFNVGTGKPTTLRELVDMIKEEVKSRIEPEWGGIPDRKNEIYYLCSDIKKINSFLNWQPQTKMKDGIKSTVKYYLSEFRNHGKSSL